MVHYTFATQQVIVPTHTITPHTPPISPLPALTPEADLLFLSSGSLVRKRSSTLDSDEGLGGNYRKCCIMATLEDKN